MQASSHDVRGEGVIPYLNQWPSDTTKLIVLMSPLLKIVS